MTLWACLRHLSGPVWRAHPWRHLAGVVAVALGVALGLSVHLVNEAALAEFGAAARGVSGQADAVVQCEPACPDAWVDRLARAPGVERVQPRLVFATHALRGAGSDPAAAPTRLPFTLLGVDVWTVGELAPDLQPRPLAGVDGRDAYSAFDGVFVNPSAWAQGWTREVRVQSGSGEVVWRVLGTVPVAGPPLAVTDIANIQHRLGRIGQVDRLDIQLQPGASTASVQQILVDEGVWPPQAMWVSPDESVKTTSALSRAYRVNLTVLALVALFVGAFLVFSIQALSVAQRTSEHALLGVLGLGPSERQSWILAESAFTGVVGAVLGVGLGTLMAWGALQALSGDLGGGFFQGVQPRLQWDGAVAVGFGAMGVLAAVAGGWLPARQVRAMAPAQALKGLGAGGLPPLRPMVRWWIPLAGGLLALMPPVGGLPVAAYASVALLLVGGILWVPALTGAVVAVGRLWLAKGGRMMRWPVVLLALQRADHERLLATVAVAGVVASLSLSVALTVMVGSFRSGVMAWLDHMLPADLYARTATRSIASDGAYLTDDEVAAVSRLPGIARVEPTRLRSLTLTPGQPPVTLVARPLTDPLRQLAVVDAPSGLPEGTSVAASRESGVDAWISEAMVSVHGLKPGDTFQWAGLTLRVRGVWKDYARQFGTVVVDLAAYRTLTGDTRSNDLAIWLADGVKADSVVRLLRDSQPGLELAQPGDIRAQSLRLFDRSFAVTRYLQALALGIGLLGLVASLSAQVLARRREFGLLAHLGFTRRDVQCMVAAEGAAWTLSGVVAGLLLGSVVATVLVHVVNPQSFHWTMDLEWPLGALGAMALITLVAAALAAGWSARAALSVDAVRAVKEDV